MFLIAIEATGWSEILSVLIIEVLPLIFLYAARHHRIARNQHSENYPGKLFHDERK